MSYSLATGPFTGAFYLIKILDNIMHLDHNILKHYGQSD